MNHAFFACIITTALLLVCHRGSAQSEKTHNDLLHQPTALGAWLYRSRCVRCHGKYEQQRPGEGFDDKAELVQAIGSGGCRISWKRQSGGEFGHKELQAIAVYILSWEAIGKEPELPPLPPLLEEKSEPVKNNVVKTKRVQPSIEEKDTTLPAALRQTIADNEVANGGWLYTRNCYRCHLGYEQARMGRSMTRETVQRFITEGKTSTQMKPFSRMLGGNLKNREIKAIATYIATWEKAEAPLAIAEKLMIPPTVDPNDYKPLRLPGIPTANGDPAEGAQLFAMYCSTCHGCKREGYTGSSLDGKHWPPRPDLFLKSVVKKGIPGSPMPSWDSNEGGIFSAKEIEDVITFLLPSPQSRLEPAAITP